MLNFGGRGGRCKVRCWCRLGASGRGSSFRNGEEVRVIGLNRYFSTPFEIQEAHTAIYHPPSEIREPFHVDVAVEYLLV